MRRFSEAPAARPLGKRLWGDRWIYLFLLPTTTFVAAYSVWPVLAGIYFSMLDWSGFEASGQFVGFENYRELWNDNLYRNALKNTFVFMVLAVPLRVALALFVALILNSALPFSRVFRTAIFLPVVSTAAILGVVMRFILDPTRGPVNLVLLQTGLIDQPVNFLGTTGLALYTAIVIWVWKWLGITLIYWMAALQTIPQDLYEAARIDGAGAWARFRDITFPLLMPFTIIITLITLVEATNVFDLLLTLTNGGPFYSSEVIDIFVYRQAFAANVPRLGYASAAALSFGVCIIGLALLNMIVRRGLRGRRSE
ncbi:carbohydrate ABC transporter permease [Pelagovum pacificum]|uniref:Sugar ABC transporter permease n=1 Tax=Pelagovum pacificum TaxID=2588711 RepID=A0A5C5GG13_9RHOB|nr:sugar ABC transporter permease [Pelagovum pacificum]QQA43871.1 sugar ABC transporter permease [Pelagovum pacificum]TNY32997.1 sugar ABC transporter permease [Pelagovum pacificum]